MKEEGGVGSVGGRVMWVMRERARCWCQGREGGVAGVRWSRARWREVSVAREGGQCWRREMEGGVGGKGGRAVLMARKEGSVGDEGGRAVLFMRKGGQ